MDKNKVFLGIDPGKTGAMVLYSDVGGILGFSDYTNMVFLNERIRGWHEEYTNILGVIEQVHAFPGQGVTGMFNFGANYGFWQGVLLGNGIPYGIVSPQRWQGEMLDKTDGKNTKERSLVMARRLFPTRLDLFRRKKDNGRADAALMAVYGSRVYSPQQQKG